MNLLFVHNTVMGYARYGSKLAEALARAGIKIDDTLDRDPPNPHQTVCWVTVPSHAQGWFEDQYTILSTMWEAQKLPEPFREALHNFNMIVVPSAQNAELFSRYHPNVVQVPLGVDTSEWSYRKRTAPTDRFVFLIGGSGTRKGVDLAYKAFRRLWPNEGSWPSDMPRPHIIFKSPRAIDYFGPRIEHIGGHITDRAEQDLYAMAHCYLQPSRGEGWGLQPLQAIAQGLPTILTDAHGHAEFAHLGIPISAVSDQSAYFIYGDAGDWWEPSLDELCERMEWVYTHYDEACANAERSAQTVAETLSWDHCAARFIEAVGRDRLNGEYRGSGRWVEPDKKRFLVRVNKPWRAEVAGSVYQFDPGLDFWEPADVKRILFEADALDPSCLTTTTEGPVTEEESGLAPEQLERLGDYSASMGHCHHCGQVLGSGVRYEPPDEP